MIGKLEEVARSVIVEAGALIRDRIGKVSSSDIQSKGPADYVTEVDMASESLIMGAIRREFPDHHIMSEESANEGLDAGYTWIIDPLDGTTNFIHGFPFVAVSIGVCKDEDLVLGLVLDPIRDELFTAKRNGGAYLNGVRIQVRKGPSLEDALIATGFPFRQKHLLDPYLATFKSVFQHVSGIRRAGAAALDLAYLAAGRVDGFWEAGLAPWDVAAGSLLVTEAGGRVSDFWGCANHLKNGHIVSGSASVYPFLLEQVQTHMAPALDPGKDKCARSKSA
jgi:myo-inositol-1(or 4)-monophosphatase